MTIDLGQSRQSELKSKDKYMYAGKRT